MDEEKKPKLRLNIRMVDLSGKPHLAVALIIATILTLGAITSVWLLTSGLVKYKTTSGAITVNGSARREIISDWVVWSGNYSFKAATLKEAYRGLVENRDKVKDYFLDKGLKEDDLIFSSTNTMVNYVILPSGMYSNTVESYALSESVEIRSKEVDKVGELSRGATELIDQGVEFQSNPPQYFYTKIADLKQEMLALATKDAFSRAQQIAKNSRSRIGSLRSAKQGVFQITPRYSHDISDYGINDTSSLDKEITAVVSCSFSVR